MSGECEHELELIGANDSTDENGKSQIIETMKCRYCGKIFSGKVWSMESTDKKDIEGKK